ncbi:SDR family oxidoreductase [Streptomyces sp. M19]
MERTVGRIQAEREVRDTVRRLTRLGSSVRYHCVDVRDAEAVHRAVKDVHAEHGRLDGIVYAAGVIEDKLFAEKSPDSFHRVFSTKTDGARTLLDAVGELSTGPASPCCSAASPPPWATAARPTTPPPTTPSKPSAATGPRAPNDAD